MDITEEQVEAGYSAYTKAYLWVYDLYVLRFANRFVWKCPSANIENLYNKYTSDNHLDVGVGTGYFLDRCKFDIDNPRIALFDANRNALEVCANRISRYNPEVFEVDVLKPLTMKTPKFDSVGMNYLLHCLPGSMKDKSMVFDNVKTLMNPGAFIFGSTLLGSGVSRSRFSEKTLHRLHDRGIVSNWEDSLDGLRQALNDRFHDVSTDVIGSVALFSGHT